jgi:uncharacterized membrane protein
MIQDALSDAETHLRAECAARPGESEESVLGTIISSYGSPTDVADAYRQTEKTVQAAFATQDNRPTTSSATPNILRQFFSVYRDARAWMSLLFMLLSLVTGVFYFTFAILGLTLSLGLAILIIGLPFLIGFIGVARVLALVEGRLVETVTGERMPRRARPSETGSLLARIGTMLRDRRSWTTLVYQLMMLPLGVLYFSIAITLTSFGAGLVGAGVGTILQSLGLDVLPGTVSLGTSELTLWLALPAIVTGVLMLTALLHLARKVARLHGIFAKNLLVST